MLKCELLRSLKLHFKIKMPNQKVWEFPGFEY